MKELIWVKPPAPSAGRTTKAARRREEEAEAMVEASIGAQPSEPVQQPDNFDAQSTAPVQRSDDRDCYLEFHLEILFPFNLLKQVFATVKFDLDPD